MSLISFGPSQNIKKCAVIGCSGAGMAAAYTLSKNYMIDALVLIDPDSCVCNGVAADLCCSLPQDAHIDIWAGDYSDLADCSLIVLSLGQHHFHECAHADLISINLPLIRKAVSDITAYNRHSIILLLSEPCEIATLSTVRYSGLSAEKIIGIGTLPQTLYLRRLLGNYLGADPRQLDAMIIGQNDANGIPCISSSHISGIPIEKYMLLRGRSFDPAILHSLFEDTVHAFCRAEDALGCAVHAIGSACDIIATCIFGDTDTVLPLCVSTDHFDGLSGVCMSMPCVLGRHGVKLMEDCISESGHYDQLRRTAARLRAQLLDAQQVQ